MKACLGGTTVYRCLGELAGCGADLVVDGVLLAAGSGGDGKARVGDIMLNTLFWGRFVAAVWFLCFGVLFFIALFNNS